MKYTLKLRNKENFIYFVFREINDVSSTQYKFRVFPIGNGRSEIQGKRFRSLKSSSLFSQRTEQNVIAGKTFFLKAPVKRTRTQVTSVYVKAKFSSRLPRQKKGLKI